MVSVLVCILPSLVSAESKSWLQFLPLPHRLLVHYLTHPPARLTLEILFIALSGFSRTGPIRSISAPLEERITNISPLQPQTPHVQRHQWIPLMCQDEYVCKCVFINLCVFLICCVWPELLFSSVHCFSLWKSGWTCSFSWKSRGQRWTHLSSVQNLWLSFTLWNIFETCCWPCRFSIQTKYSCSGVRSLNVSAPN